MKRFITLFVTFVIIASCIGISASALNSDSPYKYINDQAGVLTDKQEKDLNSKLKSFGKENKFDLAVVLVNGIDTEYDRMTFADDYYDYNGYKDDGALLLVNIAENKEYYRGNSWISTKGKCIDLIDEDAISEIGGKLTPQLLNGNYYKAVDSFPEAVSSIVKTRKVIQLGITALVTLAVCVIVAFVYTGSLKKQLKSVNYATEANNYVVENSLGISRAYDHFLYANITKTARESSNNSSHTSSSGSSHGGGGF